MSNLSERLSLPVLLDSTELCQAGEQSCIACCHGELLPTSIIADKIDRQTRLYNSTLGTSLPTPSQLHCYERRVLGLKGFAVALVLWLPLFGDFLREYLRRRVACVYLGYLSPQRDRVGCLLHPSRHHGRDLRREAFFWWRGFACGDPHWRCVAAWSFHRGLRLRNVVQSTALKASRTNLAHRSNTSTQ